MELFKRKSLEQKAYKAIEEGNIKELNRVAGDNPLEELVAIGLYAVGWGALGTGRLLEKVEKKREFRGKLQRELDRLEGK